VLWFLLLKLLAKAKDAAAENVPLGLRVLTGTCLRVLVPPSLNALDVWRGLMDRGHFCTKPVLVKLTGMSEHGSIPVFVGYSTFVLTAGHNDSLRVPSGVSFAPMKCPAPQVPYQGNA